MKNTNWLGFYVFLGATIFLLGCATVQTYSGQRLPSSEIAIIEIPVLGNLHKSTVIIEIDGSTDNTRGVSPIDGASIIGIGLGTKLELMPGSHTLKGYFIEGDGSTSIQYRPVTIRFSAEAGRVYTLQNEWLKDKKTGAKVAYFKP
jgi:hypothetical protein